jgi:polar amino acid transport system substrate-binding protein
MSKLLQTTMFMLLCVLLMTSFQVQCADRKTIKIASIDWCPQLCPGREQQGYVTDIVREVYSALEYELIIDFFPWSRAIKVVRNGEYDALLSPAKPEAPDLIYPDNPVGFQQMCFFTLNKFNWQYSGPESLARLDIGIASDTSIEELNVYIANNASQFQFQPYLDRYVEQNANKLLKHRIDTFLFTLNTTLFELKELGMDDQIKNAGCVSKANIYIAFTSLDKKAEYVEKLIKVYDEKYPQLLNDGVIEQILARYEIVNK